MSLVLHTELAKMRCLWFSTVLWLICKRFATAVDVRPVATRDRISSSRPVSMVRGDPGDGAVRLTDVTRSLADGLVDVRRAFSIPSIPASRETTALMPVRRAVATSSLDGRMPLSPITVRRGTDRRMAATRRRDPTR